MVLLQNQMIQGKNLKLKLGLCGLALTSFLALNARGNTVHADTVDSGNANAITWDSDQDDSQVVKEDSNQSQPTQNAQGQASATQSVQSNVQNRAEKSTVRVSNFDTSVVNRNNAQNAHSQANVKVATVHDTAQMPVQKTKVAQFNQGSKIYTLNGSSQLSKNNGDGYVITNAGTYNGRAVDIGVTINNVQDNQGTYTTKWSNGDASADKGNYSGNFKYQDSVLLATNADTPKLNKTRTRTVYTGQEELPYQILMHMSQDNFNASGDSNREENITQEVASYTDIYAMDNLKAGKPVDPFSVRLNKAIVQAIKDNASLFITGDDGGNVEALSGDIDTIWYDPKAEDLDKKIRAIPNTISGRDGKSIGKINIDGRLSYPITIWAVNHPLSENVHYTGGQGGRPMVYQDAKNVTDTLNTIVNSPASLGYNYTVGLYDAQTGDLITDLKAEYKGKTGNQATASTSVMNNAIKNKIQQINQGKATVSYTGTRANDDVAFYQETRQVNPQDKNVNRQVQRVIHINFPNGVKPKSYDNITDSAGNKLTLDSNNNLTQSMSFTRTGTENIVSGHVTYSNWQQHGAINAVTLPAIPGYTMTQTK